MSKTAKSMQPICPKCGKYPFQIVQHECSAKATTMTTAELVNHIHMTTRTTIPLVTDVEPIQNAVYYTIGFHRFVAMRDMSVLEVADGKMFESQASIWQQGVLRGYKRDESGNLIEGSEHENQTIST